MLRIFANQNQYLHEIDLNSAIQSEAVWIDLCYPTADEERQIEQWLGINVPTREDIEEIEISNTQYQENGTVYMTATLMTQSEAFEPEIHPVSFILLRNTLITVRYAEPKTFQLYVQKIHTGLAAVSGQDVLIDLLEILIGRSADSLEKTGHLIDDIIKKTFRPTATKNPVPFKDILQQVATCGDLISKIREQLVTLSRLIGYVEKTSFYKDDMSSIQRFDILLKDTTSLRDYASFLSDKVTFSLDATMGMINIEQNATIKIFSVAAVIFLPPTLIASIYGMNFHHMPELDWRYGYPLAISLMLLSAWLPYRFFKKKGWL